MKLQGLKRAAYSGFIENNPTFKMVLGLCPTLAVTVTAVNGLGMGLATLFVLTLSNLLVSLLRKVIPPTVRIPCYIMLIASLTTAAEMVTRKFLPQLYAGLGIFLPLIVVNCIVFARAEGFASKNSAVDSFVDGFMTGLAFTVNLTVLAAIRELLGNGSIFGATLLGEWFPRFRIFIMPAGGFLLLAFLLALYNYFTSVRPAQKRGKMPLPAKQTKEDGQQKQSGAAAADKIKGAA